MRPIVSLATRGLAAVIVSMAPTVTSDTSKQEETPTHTQPTRAKKAKLIDTVVQTKTRKGMVPTKKLIMVSKMTPAPRQMGESSHWSAQAGPSCAMEVDSLVKELGTIHIKHGHKHKRSAGSEVKEQDKSEEYGVTEEEEEDDSDVQPAKVKRARKLTIQGNGRYYKPPCLHCVKRIAHCEQQEWLVWACVRCGRMKVGYIQGTGSEKRQNSLAQTPAPRLVPSSKK